MLSILKMKAKQHGLRQFSSLALVTNMDQTESELA